MSADFRTEHRSSSLPEAVSGMTSGRFGALLAVLILAQYPDVIFGQAAFFFRDFGFFAYPLAHHHRQSFWQGEVPLWNRLNNCGLPFLAQWNTMTLYPGSLFYLLAPLSWALSVFCLLHQFLAGIGMYCLARRWTRDGLAAAVAGFSFAVNGLVINSLMWPNNVAALGWMPLVVLSAERARKQGGHTLRAAALIGGMQLLTGAPEIILQTWLIVGALWLVESLREREWALKSLGRLAAVVLLAAAAAAVQLLPFLDLLVQSHRGPGFADQSWSMPVWGPANFLVPLFHCFTRFFGVYAQYGQYWTSSYYLGSGVLVLAVFAAIRLRNLRVTTWAALAVLGVVLALGDQGGFYPLLRKAIPQFGFIRYPIKFIVLSVFCAPLLAAFAVSHLRGATVRVASGEGLPSRALVLSKSSPGFMTTRMNQEQRSWQTLASLGGIALAAIGTLIWTSHDHPSPSENWLITLRSGTRSAGFLCVILTTLYALGRTRSGALRTSLSLLLPVLIGVDGAWSMRGQNPTVTRQVFEPDLVKLSPDPRPFGYRALISSEAERHFNYFSSSNPRDDYLASRAALYFNCNLLDGIPKVDGVFSLYLRHESPIDQYLLKNSREPGRQFSALLDFLAVAQITAPGKFFDFDYRPTHMPLASAGQRPLYGTDSAVLGAVASQDFEPRREVYLPPEARGQVTVTNQTEAQILKIRFSASRAAITVLAKQPSMVVVAQSYCHSWRARIDDRPISIFRANHAYQAVEVPAGLHEVKLAYEDNPFEAGGIISVLTLAGSVWAASRSRRTPARAGRTASP